MMRVGDGWTEPETLLDWLPFCTHGTVDVACARFGYPLYRYLRDGFGGEEGGVRVWRASHFGGHVFAPTLIDLPSGLYWAYVTPAQAQPIVERSGDVRDLAPHLRGWAGLASSYAQAADCALWQRHGWDWLRQARQGQILTQHEGEAGAGASAVVRIDAAGGGEMQGVYTLRVAVTHTVATRVSTGDAGDSGYAQYSVIG